MYINIIIYIKNTVKLYNCLLIKISLSKIRVILYLQYKNNIILDLLTYNKFYDINKENTSNVTNMNI